MIFTIWQLMVMCARAASEAFHQSYIHQPIVAGEAKGRETSRNSDRTRRRGETLGKLANDRA